jgi:hypothetical protein
MPDCVYGRLSIQKPRLSGEIMLLAEAQVRTNDDRRALTRYKLTNERNELDAAFRLVYDGYMHRGLTVPNRHRMRITPYQLSRSAQVFVALNDRSVVSTLTLVEDSPAGLPMESLFQREIQSLRRGGSRLAEVTSLTHGLPSERLDWSIAERLMSLMAQFAMAQNIDRLLIVVCPQHSVFYKRIAFHPFGEVRNYSDVCGKPALPMEVNLKQLKFNHPQVYDRFFSRPFAPQELAPRRMGPTLVRHYHRILNGIEADERFDMSKLAAYQMAG